MSSHYALLASIKPIFWVCFMEEVWVPDRAWFRDSCISAGIHMHAAFDFMVAYAVSTTWVITLVKVTSAVSNKTKSHAMGLNLDLPLTLSHFISILQRHFFRFAAIVTFSLPNLFSGWFHFKTRPHQATPTCTPARPSIMVPCPFTVNQLGQQDLHHLIYSPCNQYSFILEQELTSTVCLSLPHGKLHSLANKPVFHRVQFVNSCSQPSTLSLIPRSLVLSLPSFPDGNFLTFIPCEICNPRWVSRHNNSSDATCILQHL